MVMKVHLCAQFDVSSSSKFSYFHKLQLVLDSNPQELKKYFSKCWFKFYTLLSIVLVHFLTLSIVLVHFLIFAVFLKTKWILGC